MIAAASVETQDDVPCVSTSFLHNSQEPMAPEPYIPEEPERWRNEVASRISSYKAKKRRKMEGDFSMKLEFEAPEPPPVPSPSAAQMASAVAEQKSSHEVCDTNYYRRANAEAIAYQVAAAAAALEDYDPDFDFVGRSEPVLPEPRIHDPLNTDLILSPEPETAESLHAKLDAILAEPEIVPVVTPQTTNNVILFPRPMIEPPLAPGPTTRDELAEPVFDRPRILDVPEDNVPTIAGPLFADIHLDRDTDEMTAPAAANELDLPLQVAPMMQRAFAAACDWGIVTAASIVFFVLCWKSMDGLPSTKPAMAALMMVPLGLWAVYQFMFHLYAGETPGMRFAHLRLCDFQREMPEWEQRKKRALYSTFSCVSIGVGYLWALVDEDTLCWHDRASRTYLTQE
jgi:uncharacterized RDD family membrane protein YckC